MTPRWAVDARLVKTMMLRTFASTSRLSEVSLSRLGTSSLDVALQFSLQWLQSMMTEAVDIEIDEEG